MPGYSNESISALKGADRVRKRPSVIFGSDGLEGCEHSFFEILSNAIDEARQGHGDKIIVTRGEDMSIKVQDFGRGIPVGYNKNEERYNWELLFTEMYAGGKYNTNEDDASYEFSLGLNGLGLCATQYASEFMEAQIISREGMKYDLKFEAGENVGGLFEEKTTIKQSGTTIKYKPDLRVFTDINISLDYFKSIMKRQAVVNSGIKFILIYKDAGEVLETEFFYENGIVDYLEEITQGAKLIMPLQHWTGEAEGRDREDKPKYKVKFSVAMAFSNELKFCEFYHNSSFLEYGGSPERALRFALVGEIDKIIKNSDKYLKNESKITFTDIDDSLIFISNNLSTVTSYENQTKKSITNRFIQTSMDEFLRHQLEVFFIENPEVAGEIADQMLINKRSRENAEKTRRNIKKKLSGSMDMSNRVEQFVDCRSKIKEEREIYIVEGKSAMGSVKMGRNSEYQAIIPIRGKILNCLKADLPRIFKSDIIIDLIKVLGCGIDIPGAKHKDLIDFDINKLRFDKVIICTDADVDGFQIRTLVLTMFYRLMPKLIEEGHIYIAESPLYEITTKTDTYFAYDEREYTDVLEKIGNDSFKIQRSKGLGENDADMMWLTTMNPKTRRLIRVGTDDVEHTAKTFNMLLGDDLDGRKEYIATRGHEYMDAVDVS